LIIFGFRIEIFSKDIIPKEYTFPSDERSSQAEGKKFE
jgi:hypothetical protein